MVNYQEVGDQFLVQNPLQLGLLAERIIKIAGEQTIWLVQGEMGAGKTSLIQAICKVKGVVDQVTSPSYSLIHEYQNLRGEVFYHFDFYRLKNVKEALDIGCEEYFDSGNLCFIEWPELVAPVLPEKNFYINIQVQQDQSRLIKLAQND